MALISADALSTVLYIENLLQFGNEGRRRYRKAFPTEYIACEGYRKHEHPGYF
jgi:hypothetical protein